MSESPAVIHENLPIIEAADAVALEQLLSDAIIANAVLERLAPTVAVLDPNKVEAVVTRLKKLGHLPKVV